MSTEVVHKDGSRPLKTQGSQSRLPPSGSPSRHLKTKSIDHRDEKLFADPGPDETECTFKPRINPISRSMATYLKPLHTEEGITYYLDRKKAKVQQLREKLEREQEVKCPECFEHIYNGGRSKLPENFNHKKVTKGENRRRKNLPRRSAHSSPTLTTLVSLHTPISKELVSF